MQRSLRSTLADKISYSCNRAYYIYCLIVNIKSSSIYEGKETNGHCLIYLNLKYNKKIIYHLRTEQKIIQCTGRSQIAVLVV